MAKTEISSNLMTSMSKMRNKSKFKFIIGFAGAVSVLTMAAPSYAAGKRAEIVVDADTGMVLHELNATEQRYPASITKVMTLYLLFQEIEAGRINLNDRIVYSKRAAAQSPTKLGVRPGNSVTVETAILSLVTKSANDSAVAIAEYIAGSEPAFAERMTAKAHELGMANTTFKNASGLPNAQQTTTAEDLAKLAIAIRRDFPRQYHWFGTEYMVYNGQRINNHNHLVGNVDGVDGLKTGFTNASGFNLAATSTRNGRRLVTVVLGGTTWRERDAKVVQLINDSYNKMGITRYASTPNVNYSISGMSDADRADADALLMDSSNYGNAKRGTTPNGVPFRANVAPSRNTGDFKVAVKDGSQSSGAGSVAYNNSDAGKRAQNNATVSFAEIKANQNSRAAAPVQKSEPSTINERQYASANSFDFTVPTSSVAPIASNNAASNNIESDNDITIAQMRAAAKARENSRMAAIERSERIERERQEAIREKRLAEQRAKEAEEQRLAEKQEQARKFAEAKARRDAVNKESKRQYALKNQKGNSVVQIGAFKNKADANRTLAMMSTHFPSFAAKQVVKYEDSRGTWFRARMTGIGIDAANIACKAVKSAGGACTIIK